MMMARIIKVREDENKEITNVMLDDGRSITLNEAVEEAKTGKIEGVNVSQSKNGKIYLRSNPDQDAQNNLDNLPRF
jgi:fructose-1-phosphate kinase PfkB-like protein